MKLLNSVLLLATVILLVSCNKQSEIKNGEGFVDVNGGKIWYRVTGEGNKTPILMLHGGPGYPSQYLNPLKIVGKDRKVITFDQLGCGRSDKISDTTLMTIDNFMDQTNRLLSALKIDDFYLYGHSWGTMLGVDYYLKYPEHIRGLILASPCLVSRTWESDSDSLIAELPDSTEVVLRKNIQGISQDSTVLANAVSIFWSTYYTRKTPTSADFDSTASQVGWNVYKYMWGENDYYATGTLKSYDRSNDLPSIKVPTLYVGGEFDPARPATVQYYQSLTPGSKVSVIKGAGHVTMHDNADDNVKAITEFLEALERE